MLENDMAGIYIQRISQEGIREEVLQFELRPVNRRNSPGRAEGTA